MQIDRSRFLMLTASIAASSCAGTPTPAVVPEQTVVVLSPPVTPAPPMQSAVVATEPPKGESGGDSRVSIAAQDEPEGDAAELALTSAPATCGNTIGRVGSCAGLRAPGPTCESFDDTRATCSEFATGMQPKAAEKAVACLMARSGKREICQFNVTQKCAVEALKSVCIEPYSDQPCRAIMANCSRMSHSKLTLQQCQRALSAVTSRNRVPLLTCITEGCSADYCFYNLR